MKPEKESLFTLVLYLPTRVEVNHLKSRDLTRTVVYFRIYFDGEKHATPVFFR